MKSLMLCALMLLTGLAYAGVEYRPFVQAEQEQAYQSLINELRCLVCQNQTIADSNADLAKDLRNQVYAMLQKGQSKQQVVDFMTARYGDFVLYRPAFNLKTGLLWLGPALFLLLGLIAIIAVVRQRKASTSQPLTTAEQQHLAAILEKGDES